MGKEVQVIFVAGLVFYVWLLKGGSISWSIRLCLVGEIY